MPKKVSESPTVFDRLNERLNIGELTERAQKFAAWYIDANEKLAKDAIKVQSRATAWAKETPLARVFEAQNELAEQIVERSAKFARVIWRVEKGEHKTEAAA